MSLNSAVVEPLQYSHQNTLMNADIEDDTLLPPSAHVQMLNSISYSRDFTINAVVMILDWVVPLTLCSALLDIDSTLCLVSLSFLQNVFVLMRLPHCKATPLILGDGRKVTPREN